MQGSDDRKKPRGEVQGKRQKRRIATLEAKIKSGELAREDVRLEGPFEGWIIDPEGNLVPPSKQRRIAEPESPPPPPAEPDPVVSEEPVQEQESRREKAFR